MTAPPRFVTFEGGEGAGKSTQIDRLAGLLQAAGLAIEVTREPGGTPGAETIRELLVTGDGGRWLPATEMLLHMAARHEHVLRRIRPALAAGRWVLCDRFVDSTRVYQGLAGEVGLALVDRLHREVFGRLEPELTLILDIDVGAGLARRARAGAGRGRYERLPQAFHERVRRGFLELAAAQPERCVVIDASRSEQEVADRIAGTIGERFGLPLQRRP